MVEQLSFSLFDYFPSQQSPVATPTLLSQSAGKETQMVEVGRKTYVYDCGEELHGARKHLVAMAKFSVKWQKAIEEDPTQAFQIVCKEELLSDFNEEQLQEEGFTSEAAYAVKLIWGRVCQRPEDDPKQREYFIQAVTELRNRLSTAKNEQAVRDVINQLKDDLYKARYSTYAHKLKSEPELIQFRFWLSLGDRFKSLFISRSRRYPGYYDLFEKAFSSEQGKDWFWAKAKSRENNSARKDNVERWKRKVPEVVVRLSQEPSGVGRPEDLIELYGFRGIQFGNVRIVPRQSA